jgi:hypothetical protein
VFQTETTVVAAVPPTFQPFPYSLFCSFLLWQKMAFTESLTGCRSANLPGDAARYRIQHCESSFLVSFGTASVDNSHFFSIDRTYWIVPSSLQCSRCCIDHPPREFTCRYTNHPSSAGFTNHLQLPAGFPTRMVSAASSPVFAVTCLGIQSITLHVDQSAALNLFQ